MTVGMGSGHNGGLYSAGSGDLPWLGDLAVPICAPVGQEGVTRGCCLGWMLAIGHGQCLSLH